MNLGPAETPSSSPRTVTRRRTRLLRVPDLRAFHRAIALAACGADLPQVRATAVIVPSTAAARELRRTLENLCLDPASRLPGLSASVLVMPALLSREDWYRAMHERLPCAPRRLTEFEREVLLAAAARRAVGGGVAPPFKLRPRLIAEMLALYDELRRRRQSVDRFEELLVVELEPQAEADRGAARMLQQTRFLTAAFREYEARVEASGSLDEHTLRALVLRATPDWPLKRLVITVGDRAAGGNGLWAADFDLLARAPLVDELTIVSTEAELAAGLHERLHDLLPGIEEVRLADVRATAPPVLLAPPRAEDPVHFVERDREEELVAVARRLKARHAARPPGSARHVLLERTAVVVRRPLPYIYLAREVFGSSGIPYQALDTLPLASEPYAATLDLVFSFITSGFSRSATIALLRSPHLAFEIDGTRVGARAIAALDRLLSEAGYLGDRTALLDVAEGRGRRKDTSAPVWAQQLAATAAAAVAAACTELQALTAAAPATVHLTALIDFLVTHDSPPAAADPLRERHQRARGAILGALDALRSAYGAHDDVTGELSDRIADIRRWIEGQTFAPRTGSTGVHLIDAAAARYADLDACHVAGLVEGEWPETPKRNIFYSPFLLGKLGWPADTDRLKGPRAAFHDLLRLPQKEVSVSTFVLEGDASVEPSAMLGELGEASLAIRREEEAPPMRMFVHEALSHWPVRPEVLPPDAALWAALRIERTPHDADRYHGSAGSCSPAGFGVAALERYLDCPFKFFAVHVLTLEEEPEDEEVMSPRVRGRFIHEVFQTFFNEWHGRGHRGITRERIEDARALFAEVIEPMLFRLPAAEASLERTRLVGSPVAIGLAEAVFRMEAERPTGVVERLLEYRLDGEFEIAGDGGNRRVPLRGVADRIDLLADGTFRLIDYKTGRAPSAARALQLPIYSVCAAQRLEDHGGRRWALGEAAYVAFGGPRSVVPMVPRGADRDQVLADAQTRLLSALDGIERGEFPPRPAEPFLCTYCAYASVCRKDYVEDE